MSFYKIIFFININIINKIRFILFSYTFVLFMINGFKILGKFMYMISLIKYI